MPVNFIWLATDQHGRVAQFDAERWGDMPEDAPLLFETDEGETQWNALRERWATTVAPLHVLEHNDLAMVPDSDAPHLVAFAEGTVELAGGVPVPDQDALRLAGGARVYRFERPTPALRGIVELDDEREDAAIVGSRCLDDDTFSADSYELLYRFSRDGDDPRYRREAPPKHPLTLDADFVTRHGIFRLDVDFAAAESLDIASLVDRTIDYGLNGRSARTNGSPREHADQNGQTKNWLSRLLFRK
ncbi:MAG: hypothetical protein AAF645_30575 [Myxococcota bacterium]